MDYDSLLSVENKSEDLTYFFAYNSQRFSVKPGKTSLIPFDALRLAMGDPRSGPEVSRITPEGGGVAIQIPSRKDEIRRLSVLYGIYTEDISTPSFVDNTNGETLMDRIPKIVVKNLDDEEAIVFPCDDPLCERFTPEDQDKSQVAVMQRQLESMRRKQAVMEQIIKASNGNEIATQLGDGTEVTEDVPNTGPAMKARTIKAG